jgi:hypothetical protein
MLDRRTLIPVAFWVACLLGDAAFCGPLVREVKSSDSPFSQVITRSDGDRSISLILDREEYDPLDLTGVAVIRIRPKDKKPGDLLVRLQLRDDKGEMALTEVLRPVRGTHLDVTLALANIELGNYTLHSILTDKTGATLGEASAPLRKRVKRKQATVPDRQQVELLVWPAEGQMESDWPIMTGVPFPQGVLFEQKQVRLLDDNGNEVPCQTSVRSAWNRHGSIRWLGLDFIGRLSKPGARYTVEYGRQVRRAATSQMDVDENAEAIRVNTGPLRFTVRKRGFNLIDEVTLNGASVSRQNAKAGLELTDHEGSVYRASNDPDVQVVIEETGPVRTTIRATGWYVKDGTSGERTSPFLPTDRLCKHDTRITAYAGKPYVTVQHALIVTFDTHKVRLKHAGITQCIAGASTGAFGLDGKVIDAPASEQQSIRLYQPATVDGQVESGDPAQPEFRVVEKGKRGDGWVRLSGAEGSLTLCVTDFWQLFPKELELREDRISLNIWPRYGRTYTGVNPLDLREIYKAWWCHTGPELAFPLPKEVYEIEKKVWPQGGEYVYENDLRANAQGVAIENNFLMAFDTTADAEESARLNATYQYGPHAWADPRWVCDTSAFGRMIAKDEERYPTAEAYLNHAVSLRLAAQEYARDYGMFNYGCIHSDDSHFREGKWGLDRVWKDHHGAPRIPWIAYARSGDPKHFHFARRNSRHVMNVDTIHYVTPDYDLSPEHVKKDEEYRPRHEVGAHYGCYGLQHWGDQPCVACMWVNGEYDQLFWNYYTTGNRRALDVAMLWVEAIKRTRYAGETGREFSSVGAEALEAFQATWDPGLLEIIDNTASAIGAAHFYGVNDDRRLGNHWLNMAPFVDRYLPFTGNENFRRRTLAWGLDNSPYDGPRVNTQALKYYETGEVAHLKECLADVYFLSLRYSPQPPRISDRSGMYGWLKTVFRATHWPVYLRALSDADIPLFVASTPDEPFPGNGRVRKTDDGGKTRSVCVIRPGQSADFSDKQVWYFRTAANQKSLKFQVTQRDGEGAVHIRTRDGSKIVAHIGADGYRVGGDGTLKVDVEPETLYYMATSGGPSVTPFEYPLVLSHTVEDWFEPQRQGR